jgi:hypothetical protein
MHGRSEKLVQEPASVGARTCPGIERAVNCDFYKSMDVLEETRALEPGSFLAQFKYAELQYRLRALEVAETETQRALELASSFWEFTQARNQLSEIRRVRRKGTIKPTWDRAKSLAISVICYALILAIVAVLFTVSRT